MPFLDGKSGTNARQPLSERDVCCNTCVYHSLNLDRTMYEGKGIAALPEDGCSLDFVFGNDGCIEMRTNNCSMRRLR